MAELLRQIDARTSSDADGSKYFVVFCSRDSDNIATKPGHAFVVWGVEDASNQRSVQKSFGFYPDSNDETKAVFGTVSGQIKDEALSLAASNLFTARLIVQVNKTEFEDSQSQIATWGTTDYNLYGKNCIHFARAVAVSLQLFPPSVGLFQLPTSYLHELISQTTSGEGSGAHDFVIASYVALAPNGVFSSTVFQNGESRVVKNGQVYHHQFSAAKMRELEVLIGSAKLNSRMATIDIGTRQSETQHQLYVKDSLFYWCEPSLAPSAAIKLAAWIIENLYRISSYPVYHVLDSRNLRSSIRRFEIEIEMSLSRRSQAKIGDSECGHQD